jgi:hypothetical protein
VYERRDGTRRLYRANADALEALQRYLSELWSSSLNVAKALAEGSGDQAEAVG